MNNKETFEEYLQAAFIEYQVKFNENDDNSPFDFTIEESPQDFVDPLDESVDLNLDLAQNKESILKLCQQILRQPKERPSPNIQQNRNFLTGRQEIDFNTLEVYVHSHIPENVEYYNDNISSVLATDITTNILSNKDINDIENQVKRMIPDQQPSETILGEMKDLMENRSTLVDYQKMSELHQFTPQQNRRVGEALTRLEDDIRAKFYTYFNSLDTPARNQVMDWGVIGVPTQNNSLSTSASSSTQLFPMSSPSSLHTGKGGANTRHPVGKKIDTTSLSLNLTGTGKNKKKDTTSEEKKDNYWESLRKFLGNLFSTGGESRKNISPQVENIDPQVENINPVVTYVNLTNRIKQLHHIMNKENTTKKEKDNLSGTIKNLDRSRKTLVELLKRTKNTKALSEIDRIKGKNRKKKNQD